MNPVVMWCSIVQPLPPSRRATEAQFRGDDLAKGGGFVLASSFHCWFEIGLSIFVFSVFRGMIRGKKNCSSRMETGVLSPFVLAGLWEQPGAWH